MTRPTECNVRELCFNCEQYATVVRGGMCEACREALIPFNLTFVFGRTQATEKLVKLCASEDIFKDVLRVCLNDGYEIPFLVASTRLEIKSYEMELTVREIFQVTDDTLISSLKSKIVRIPKEIALTLIFKGETYYTLDYFKEYCTRRLK